jgi:serine/threonine protein phosphatase PrpC
MIAKRYLIDSISVDIDQQKGSLDKKVPIQDYCQSKNIMTPSGLKVFLSIVADGGGEDAPDVAAKLAVDTIFDEFARTSEKDLDNILLHSLTLANQAVYQQNHGVDYVGITIIAINKDNLLHIGQAGQLTRAYLVQKNQEEIITFLSESDDCLGDKPTQADFKVNQFKGPIKRGERIVICSDGLFEPPEDGQTTRETIEKVRVKIRTEIPIVGQYDEIRGSARHLSSIAKGLDVRDDITVVVLGLGRKSAKPSKNILAAGIAAMALLLVVLAVLTLPPQQPPRPPDLGLAVLFSGNASSVDPQTGSQKSIAQFSLIDPGTTLLVSNESPIELKLKRRTDIQGTNTVGISGVDLYLSEQSEASLTTLDMASLSGDKPTDPLLLNLTEITLNKGQLLIVSDGSRKYTVLIPSQKKDKNIQVVLASGGAGILGVRLQVPNLEIYCLQGTCQFIPIKGETVTLLSPGETNIDTSNFSVLSVNVSVIDADWQIWNSICNSSQPESTCKISK